MVIKDTAIIIQARYNSKRFKGKIFQKINKKALLEILIERLKKSKTIKKIIIASTKNKLDKKIINFCNKKNINVFVGSEKNVLSRYYFAAKKFKLKHIVRITSDCPFVCPKLLDMMILKYKNKKIDYLSNINPPTFPDGMDIEIFNFKALKDAFFNAKYLNQKEHVTKYIVNSQRYKKFNFKNLENLSHLRVTVDYPEDIKILKKIAKHFRGFNFSFKDLHIYLKKNNTRKKDKFRNLSEYNSLGQAKWQKAKNIIPGGVMLFSKNPDLYLPKKWPAYFSKTKGCAVWDLNKKKYLDMSFMGLGTNILGYSDSRVDSIVKKVVKEGNLSTLNNIEEVELAERLVGMHPWSDMAFHVRTGAEANAVAVRLARAATSKNKVGICGYHGWSDWYLSSNLKNKNALGNHLMNNLSVKGVDTKLKNSTFVFNFNDYKSLDLISKSDSFAAIIMELARKDYQDNNFLKKLRQICNKKKIVLIFDECTSGFRENFGGLHIKLKVNPDIATFGKALGNGYSICSVVGRREILSETGNSFISSTFWTDRIGPAAACKVLNIMERTKSWKIISKIGFNYKKKLKKICDENKVPVEIYGLDALPKFNFKKNNNFYKTFITQEFLKYNILATNGIYTCVKHEENYMNKYFDNMNDILIKISKNYFSGEDPVNLLENDVAIASLREKIN